MNVFLFYFVISRCCLGWIIIWNQPVRMSSLIIWKNYTSKAAMGTIFTILFKEDLDDMWRCFSVELADLWIVRVLLVSTRMPLLNRKRVDAGWAVSDYHIWNCQYVEIVFIVIGTLGRVWEKLTLWLIALNMLVRFLCVTHYFFFLYRNKNQKSTVYLDRVRKLNIR